MAKKSEIWTNGCLTSVKAGQRILSHLYDSIEADADYGQCQDEEVVFPSGDCISPRDGAKMFTRHCTHLVAKLSSPTDARVRLPLGPILKLVHRCLNVSYTNVISVPSLKELSEILPGLHMQVLDILSYLILCCGTNLLPKSRTILDLCLQALEGTEKMEPQRQSNMRASVYRVLCLWIEMAGLGTYYLAKVKDFHRELAKDVGLDQKHVQPSNGTTQTAPSPHENQQKRKGKGKKKGSRKAESYLNSNYANFNKGSTELPEPQGVAATLGALQVCQLVAERAQFLPLQGLMRCLLDTTSTLQRQPPPDLSPYADPKCRVSLYHAVFTFATIPLDHVTNSADTVTHFQLTSQAHSPVLHAGFSDPCIEVQKTCQNLLNSCKVIGVVNRPIVRKVLQDDQIEFKDVAELERQMEEMREDNERLKSKLLQAEIETQRQSRLASSFKQEMEGWKNAAQTSQTEEPLPQKEDSESEEEEKEEEVEMSGDELTNDTAIEEENKSRKTEGETTKSNKGFSEESDGELTTVHQPGVKTNNKKKRKQKDRINSVDGSTNSLSKDCPVKESGKRNLPVDVVEGSCEKKLRQEEPLEDQSSDIQAMLMDFVDAEPDSD